MIVQEEAEVAVLVDKAQHLRVKGFLLELQMYRVEWVVGQNLWGLGGPIIDFPVDAGPKGEELLEAPRMEHKQLTLKSRKQVSYEANPDDCKQVAVLQFDGGAAKQMGTGGFLCWAPGG